MIECGVKVLAASKKSLVICFLSVGVNWVGWSSGFRRLGVENEFGM